MAVITNYDTLVTAIENYLGREDLNSFVPNWIEACENKLYRSLEIRGLENATGASIAPSIAISSIQGSKTFRNIKQVILTSTTPNRIIEPATLEQLYREYPNRSQTSATPKVYARQTTSILFGPPAGSGAQATFIWYELLPNLNSSDPTTNWFTSNFPELLLYGALLEAEPFVINDKRILIWRALYEDAMKTLKEFERRETRGGGTMSIKVV